jgi:hypothetical protein
MATNDSDQYVLVHHEYAGLSGFEVNNGPDSTYLISNQISEFLVDEVVKKLAIKAPLADLNKYVGNYTWLGRPNGNPFSSLDHVEVTENKLFLTFMGTGDYLQGNTWEFLCTSLNACLRVTPPPGGNDSNNGATSIKLLDNGNFIFEPIGWELLRVNEQ